jgi:hypothetical protein
VLTKKELRVAALLKSKSNIIVPVKSLFKSISTAARVIEEGTIADIDLISVICALERFSCTLLFKICERAVVALPIPMLPIS